MVRRLVPRQLPRARLPRPLHRLPPLPRRGHLRRRPPLNAADGSGLRLRETGAADADLQVADDSVLDADLQLVAFDFPVIDRRQPSPRPSSMRDLAPAAVDQGLPPGNSEILALLHFAPAPGDDLVVGRLTRDD